MLNGAEPYVFAPTAVPPSDLLPAAERRRTGMPVKIALAVAQQACADAARDPAALATVFTSSSGDGDTVHHIFESLASPEREVSPTRFHNSVHNAAAGYWSIATQSRQPSTSLCCYDASFSAGLLDAATQALVSGIPVALIAYDHPYPEPLHSKRRLYGTFGVALVIAPEGTPHSIARMTLRLSSGAGEIARMENPQLETLRSGIPAARSLPLLRALACSAEDTIAVEYSDATHLSVGVSPLRAASREKGPA